MFEAENIRDWREHDVVDADGHKIGELEAIYVDTGTDLPSFGTVRIGMIGRHRLVFVPLDRATVGRGMSRSPSPRSRSRMHRRSRPTASWRQLTKQRSSSTMA